MVVDMSFKKAIDALSAYEKRQHLNTKTLLRMAAAKETDRSSLKVLNSLQERFRVREEFAPLRRGSYSVILTLILGR